MTKESPCRRIIQLQQGVFVRQAASRGSPVAEISLMCGIAEKENDDFRPVNCFKEPEMKITALYESPRYTRKSGC